MRKTIVLLLAIFVVFSACTFAVSAAKPDKTETSNGAGKPETLPPINEDDDPAPEIIELPTDQADNTPAAGHAPDSITEDGPGIDWLPPDV